MVFRFSTCRCNAGSNVDLLVSFMLAVPAASATPKHPPQKSVLACQDELLHKASLRHAKYAGPGMVAVPNAIYPNKAVPLSTTPVNLALG